jgi:hypothetical protein
VEPGFRWIKNPAAISPVWLEKPERIATLAMLTVVGLLVYAGIQRQVRLYLCDHGQKIPGTKGPTATPTPTVVFALFAPVMLAQFAVDEQISFQVHGLQPHHLLICDAIGLDPTWYGVPAIRQNSPPRITPPWTWDEPLFLPRMDADIPLASLAPGRAMPIGAECGCGVHDGPPGLVWKQAKRSMLEPPFSLQASFTTVSVEIPITLIFYKRR